MVYDFIACTTVRMKMSKDLAGDRLTHSMWGDTLLLDARLIRSLYMSLEEGRSLV